MHQHSLKRLLSVSLLAGGLAFMGPAQVHAAPVTGPQGLWKWLAQIWGEGVAVVWERPEAGHLSSQRPTWQKQGICIDPNGGCSPQSATSAGGPTCHVWTEQGICIDPNG